MKSLPIHESSQPFHVNPVDHHHLLGQLCWRYATKQFDPDRKISPEDWATLEMALVLSPSSFGLQPWTFIVVSDAITRAKLMCASNGQRQIVDASHLVVFTVKTDLGEEDIDAYLRRISEVRQVPIGSLALLRAQLVGGVALGMDETSRRAWESRQVYLALGVLLTGAALLGIDACPMEDIAPAEYDATLGLKAKRLATVVVCALGYRSAGDKHASLPKVRFRTEDVLLHV
jgi:nitroreductase